MKYRGQSSRRIGEKNLSVKDKRKEALCLCPEQHFQKSKK